MEKQCRVLAPFAHRFPAWVLLWRCIGSGDAGKGIGCLIEKGDQAGLSTSMAHNRISMVRSGASAAYIHSFSYIQTVGQLFPSINQINHRIHSNDTIPPKPLSHAACLGHHSTTQHEKMQVSYNNNNNNNDNSALKPGSLGKSLQMAGYTRKH